MKEEYSTEEVLALVIGTTSKALAAIHTATLSALIKSGALTEQIVRDEVLKGLRESAAELRSKIEDQDNLNPDKLTADSIDNHVGLIERWLFSEKS